MCENAIVFMNKPKGVTLEANKEYYICQCGRSEDGIFCDGSHEGSGYEPKKTVVEKTKPYLICRCKASKNFPFCDGVHSYYSDEQIGKKV
jgi:CDGSH-type Zn-finger protein